MSKYVNIPVAFQKDEEGREYLSDQQLADDESLQDFVRRFSSYFDYDPMRHVYWFKRPDIRMKRA